MYVSVHFKCPTQLLVDVKKWFDILVKWFDILVIRTGGIMIEIVVSRLKTQAD
jgi:hypothetical protein